MTARTNIPGADNFVLQESITAYSDEAYTNARKLSGTGIELTNIFDKEAPFIKSYTDANTDTMTYDLMGRRWNLRLNYRW